MFSHSRYNKKTNRYQNKTEPEILQDMKLIINKLEFNFILDELKKKNKLPFSHPMRI
jgi:hypothetical protein